MIFENFERGYLLPENCKDLIDVLRLRRGPVPKILIKPPLAYSKLQPVITSKPESAPAAMKGDLFVSEETTVKELAALLGQKAYRIIADAMELGTFAHVNQAMGFKAISQIAKKYGYTAKRAA